MRRLEEAGEGRHTLGRSQDDVQAAGERSHCLEYQSSVLWVGTQGFWRSAKGLGKPCLTKELSRDLSLRRRLALEDSELSNILRAQPVQRVACQMLR